MREPTPKVKPNAKVNLVSVPVFASADPVGRVTALAVAGQRDMQVSVRGERVVERAVEVVRKTSLEEMSRDLTLDQLVEVLKVKMYNESIADQKVYDLLFEDRLERQRANAPQVGAPGFTSFWKKPK